MVHGPRVANLNFRVKVTCHKKTGFSCGKVKKFGWWVWLGPLVCRASQNLEGVGVRGTHPSKIAKDGAAIVVVVSEELRVGHPPCLRQ